MKEEGKPEKIKLHEVEELYAEYLSRDYELLYKYVQREKPVLCFMDDCKYSRWRRDMQFTKTTGSFSSLWLWSENVSKERYMEFCKKVNLTFIKPK